MAESIHGEPEDRIKQEFLHEYGPEYGPQFYKEYLDKIHGVTYSDYVPSVMDRLRGGESPFKVISEEVKKSIKEKLKRS
jgi:hypothetical protein